MKVVKIVIADHCVNITRGEESLKRVGISSGSEGVIRAAIASTVKIVGICDTKDTIEIKCSDSHKWLAKGIVEAVKRYNRGAVKVKIIANKAAHVSSEVDKDEAREVEDPLLHGEDLDSADEDYLPAGTGEDVTAAAAAPSSAPSTSGLESNAKWLEYHGRRDAEIIENKELTMDDGRLVKITKSNNANGTENRTIFIKEGARGVWREGAEVRNADGRMSYIADGESVPAGAEKLESGGNYKNIYLI